MKIPVVILIIILAIGGFILTSNVHLGNAQSRTPVSGIIDQNTTWTKENSPYGLIGPIAIDKNVTLTIEPGVSVNLNGYYIQVNGTLTAKGSNTQKITFNNGQIIFTQLATSYNEQNSSGCIIENTIFNSQKATSDPASLTSKITIINCQPKINQNDLNAYIETYNSPLTISNNNLNTKYGSDFLDSSYMSLAINGGSPNIVNNTITGITIGNGSPTITNNYITRGSNTPSYGAINVYSLNLPIIANNTIEGGKYSWSNPIYPGGSRSFNGISGAGNAYIYGNVITNCDVGIKVNQATIERNYIVTNSIGIQIGSGAILNNTVTYDSTAIWLNNPGTVTLAFNNIESSNKQYTIYLQSSSNINATSNWWGTADTNAISYSIFDYKNDFNLGKVSFVPFLQVPNLQATNNPTTPPASTPLATPTQTPTSPPTQPPTPTPSYGATSTPLPLATPTPSSTPTVALTPTTVPTQLATPTQSPSPSPSPAPTLSTPALPAQTVAIEHSMQPITQADNNQTLTIIVAGIAILLIAILAFVIKIKRNIGIK